MSRRSNGSISMRWGALRPALTSAKLTNLNGVYIRRADLSYLLGLVVEQLRNRLGERFSDRGT